jgi:hypothetical protein
MHLTFFDVIALIALAYLAFYLAFKVKQFYPAKFGPVDEETKAWEARMFGRCPAAESNHQRLRA